MNKAIFCWSGGKDSAYALHQILLEKQYDVRYLLTTVNDEFKRISMHGVRETLLDLQAEAIGIPLLKVRVREGSNAEYEREMEKLLVQAKADGVTHVIFGDIFLEDLRAYREQNLHKVGLQGVFPLWQKDTRQLINDFIDDGFKTIVCCTNDAYLDESWVGRHIDQKFVNELPATVDPCGENGEYHTFCYQAPYFSRAIAFTLGETIYRPLAINTNAVASSATPTRGFWFCDLIPA